MLEGLNMARICLFGLGYVGLPTAVVFASKGFNVIGVDIDTRKVEAINRGNSYLREPGLDKLLEKVVASGKLRATTDAGEALNICEVVLVDVPTPVRNGVADLSYVADVLSKVSRKLRRGMLVVIESTVPPGTTAGLARKVLEKSSGLRAEADFFLAHAPERIAPGRAIDELLSVPRIVGGVGPRSTEAAFSLYSRVNPNILKTDATTAEFVKLAENTFRDLNIAFANLLALMAEKLGIDAYEAIKLANTHPRVNIHWPGAGVGGPCLTKDPYMLARVARNVFGTELITLARRINEHMPYHTVELAMKAIEEAGIPISEARIAVLGVAYKGGVDDTRGSPAKIIIRELLNNKVEVIVYDPYTRETFGAQKAETLEEAIVGSDAVIIVTDHPEFRQLDLDTLGRLMRHRIIVDGRRVIEPYVAFEKGFKYYGIGFGRAFRL